MSKVIVEFNNDEDRDRYFKNISVHIKGIKQVSKSCEFTNHDLHARLVEVENILKLVASRDCGKMVNETVDKYLYQPKEVDVDTENAEILKHDIGTLLTTNESLYNKNIQLKEQLITAKQLLREAKPNLKYQESCIMWREEYEAFLEATK